MISRRWLLGPPAPPQVFVAILDLGFERVRLRLINICIRLNDSISPLRIERVISETIVKTRDRNYESVF